MKILASDLDGTLFKESAIHEKDVEALKTLKEHGHTFIISTGRNLDGVKNIFKDYKCVVADYMVLCNGALILDKDFNVVYNKKIKGSIINSLIKDYIDDDNVCFGFDDGSGMCVVEGKYIVEKGFNIEEFSKRKLTREEAIEVKNDHQIIAFHPRSKCIEESETIKQAILDKYGDEVEVFRNQHYLDVVPRGCSKGSGLKRVIDMSELKLDNLYTIGDSLNDISMFKITKNSYTFNNAEEMVKATANNHVDYVYECISKILEK